MRTLIVSANQEHKPDPVVPLGAAMVAGAAREAGHEVAFFDACFAGLRWADELRERLGAFQPQVVGLSLRNVDDVAWPRAVSYLPHYRRVAGVIREAAPGAKLVLGGSAFSLFPREFMKELGADFGICGEGEQAFARLLADFEAGFTPARILQGDALALAGRAGVPALELLDLDQYYRRGGALNVQTRRGCPFICAYCTYPMLEGAAARPASITQVIDLMERLHDERGYDHFFVVDNTFNVPAAHALAFCDALQRRRLNIRWTAYVTPAGLTRELVRAMADAGCTSVDLGTDAASPATLAGLNKSFGQGEIERACRWLREAGIRFSHSLILGGPGESVKTLEETRRIVNATRPSAVIAMLGVRLYPNTPLERQARREGLLGGEPPGLEPLFYISDAVRDVLVDFAKRTRDAFPFWYFPGLEGDRWQRLWQRQRQHGAKGPLWALGESIHVSGDSHEHARP